MKKIKIIIIYTLATWKKLSTIKVIKVFIYKKNVRLAKKVLT